MEQVIYDSELLKTYANAYSDHLDNNPVPEITDAGLKIAYELGREHARLEDEDITSLTYLSDSEILKLIKQKIHGKSSNGE
jgi:hypothetical protein